MPKKLRTWIKDLNVRSGNKLLEENKEENYIDLNNYSLYLTPKVWIIQVENRQMG
jgi:hypothetical protein